MKKKVGEAEKDHIFSLVEREKDLGIYIGEYKAKFCTAHKSTKQTK